MKKLIISAFLALTSLHSEAVDCSGKVTLLGFDLDATNSTLIVSLEGGPSAVRVCGLTEDYNGVNKDICKIFHSELLAAKLADRSVMIRFPDHESCSSIPAWQSSKVRWHTFN